MNDSELCKMFGTTAEQVESDCEKHESGDFSGWEFGKPVDGRPEAAVKKAADYRSGRLEAVTPDEPEESRSLSDREDRGRQGRQKKAAVGG